MTNPIWTVGTDNNRLSVKPGNKNVNFDPETYSTTSDDMIDSNNMWNRFQKTLGGIQPLIVLIGFQLIVLTQTSSQSVLADKTDTTKGCLERKYY